MGDEWEDEKTPEMTFTAGRGKFMDGGKERTVGGSTYGGSTYGNNQSSHDNNNGDEGSTYGGGTDNMNGGSSYGRGGGSSYGNQGSSYGNNDNGEHNDGDEGGSYRGGGRGRGRGRGRGGSRGGRRDDDENRNGESSWGGGGGGGDDEGEGDRGHRGGRGRGGRGRGRGGGRGGGRGDDGDGDDRPSYGRNKDGDGDGGGEGEEGGEPQKPRELYIPPEPSNEDSDIFGGGITSGINFSQYDKIQVKVSGENCPKPIASFENCGLRSLVLENIKKSGYTIPTPIQKYTTPIIMAGRDVMGCAQTGSGKTASFLIPIINSLLSDPTDLVVTGEHTEPQCIIVAPTRELAQQIRDEARKFARSSILKVVLVYGGTGVRYQLEAVEGGAHILVGTPGRLQDFIGRGKITFSSLRFMVLDEADRMLDLGFGPEIEKMMTHQTMVPAGERQTLMFSATFPEEIQQGAAKYLSDYIFIAVGILGGACADVEQLFYQVTKFEKKNKLKEMLESADKNEGTLVFVETKRNADFIAALLSEAHLPTTSIHGDRLQREREEALRDFKSGSKKVLVATAVAARGLDIKNVAHVINYDLPKTIDEYVHRIGRTGRVGNKGKATSFYDDSQDTALAGDLMRILKDAGQAIPDWLSESPSGGSYSNSNYGGSDIRRDNTQGGAPAVQEEEEEW